MLVVRVTENVRTVQSSYYSIYPWIEIGRERREEKRRARERLRERKVKREI
jgi:hypothetical protein